jgi:hypothetical protein
MTAKTWLRAGLLLLVLIEGVIGVWQYFFTHSFFTGFPTVALDPPYNEHLLSDVGGLTLALAAVVGHAAIRLEYRLVRGALAGFIVFALSHLAFHATHLAGFDAGDAIAVLAVLGVDAVLPILLLVLARHVHRGARAVEDAA